jgi:hypothetical protein
MLAYYTNWENYLVTYNVDMHVIGIGNYYAITPGSFPLFILNEMQTNLQTAELLATNWVTKSRLSYITYEFNFVVSQMRLTGTNFGDLSPYPIVPADGSAFKVNITNMTLMPNRPGGNYVFWNTGGWWNFGAQSTLQTTLNFPQGGTYQVIVNAYGIPAEGNGSITDLQGIYPILNVYLGPSKETTTITATNYCNYTNLLTVPFGGAWTLALDFDNANYNGTRNILMDGIQIIKQ